MIILKGDIHNYIVVCYKPLDICEWAIPVNIKHASIRMTFIENLGGGGYFEPCPRGSKTNFKEGKVSIFDCVQG